MLIQFRVANFRSFNDPVTFSMVAANISAQDKHVDQNNVYQVDKDLNLLKTTAIYGANASGKSNLIAALRFMKEFVLNSSKESQAAEAIPVEPFRLSTTTMGKPALFEVVFLVDGTKYRYGFEVNLQQVVSEWLFHVPTIREAKLFERAGDQFSIMPAFKEGKGLGSKTRDNALFLSVSSQFNGKIAQKVLQWFKDLGIINGLNDLGLRQYTASVFEQEEFKGDIIEFVKNLDVGIDDIQVRESPFNFSIPTEVPEELNGLFSELKKISERQEMQSQTVLTTHRKFDRSGNYVSAEMFDIDKEESEGTRKIFALAGPIIETLKNGDVLIIDEFDARLHPLITRAVINLFNSKDTNQTGAQLVFVTHDTNLLDKKIFRRDQVWFTEKDKLGATHLYSLAEYKERNDASFEDNYVRGKYGAIPFIGDLNRLLGDPHE